MLTFDDRAAIDEAFNAAAPRPIADVMLEVYPEATIDALGRFHAPYDGYECRLTGNLFRGGEYIPMLDGGDGGMAMGCGGALGPHGRDISTGEVVEWNGTRAQNRAAWGELIAQTKRIDAAKSRHVGVVGGKLPRTDLTIEYTTAWRSDFGYNALTFLHVMKDLAGNVIVYKGSKELGRKGDTIVLTGKVKAHGERDGVAQTIIERPKLAA